MTEQLSTKTQRIEVVDALRGLAVMAIILLHNVEHFNLYDFPEVTIPWLKTLDGYVWDSLFFLFSGKAYAIFALLFGFGFYVQLHGQEKRGKDFRLRYFWRLLLLFGLGCLNAAFFPGEVLVLYSIVGLILIPTCKLSNKWVLAIAAFLMLQPVEWCRFIYYSLHPEVQPVREMWLSAWNNVLPVVKSDDLWKMLRVNLWDGQLFSLGWAWSYGRFFQTAALFLLGMWIGRTGKFRDLVRHNLFWKKVAIVSILCFIPLYVLYFSLGSLVTNELALRSMQTIVSSLRNVSFMFFLVSTFLFLWQQSRTQKVLHLLRPYGKMSLTNYITQSIIGSFLYFGYGLSLFDDLCTTESLLVGIAFFVLQLYFCHWWLRKHKYGPFEYLWRKLTWIRIG